MPSGAVGTDNTAHRLVSAPRMTLEVSGYLSTPHTRGNTKIYVSIYNVRGRGEELAVACINYILYH